MLKKWVYFFSLILISCVCFADGVSNPPLNIEETDGSPSTYPYKLKVTNGTLTDNGDGTASLTTGGAPTNADYLTGTANGSLSAEIVVGTTALDLTNLGSTLVGGALTTSDLFLKTTSGAGATGADMHFLVGNNGNKEAMLITNKGNVGIGISTPGFLNGIDFTSFISFHNQYTTISTASYSAISGGTSANGLIISQDNANADSRLWLLGSQINGTSSKYILSAYNDTGGTETNFITVLRSGNVGIGVTSPGSKLTIKAASDTAATVEIQNTAGTIATEIRTGADTTSLFIGTNAGVSAAGNAFNNTALGALALAGLLAANAHDNVAVGYKALNTNTSGFSNIGIGTSALAANLTGSNNVAIGVNALKAADTTTDSVAIGGGALAANTSGNYNVAIGGSSLNINTTGTRNFALGSNVLLNSNGSRNVGIGVNSLNRNTTGNDNIGIGDNALYNNQTGITNTVVGNGAGSASDGTGAINSYSNNTFFGYRAGYAASTGANNILIGYKAGDALTTGSNNIALGYDIDLPSNTTSNQMSIGNIIFATGVDGTGTTLSTGNVGIGIATPTHKLDVAGTSYFNSTTFEVLPSTYSSAQYPIMNFTPLYDPSFVSAVGTVNICLFSPTYNDANTGSTVTGADIVGTEYDFLVGKLGTNAQSVSALTANLQVGAGAVVSKVIATANAINIPAFILSNHTVTNAIGVNIGQQKVTGVTTGYGIYQSYASDYNYFAGNVGIGTTGPNAAALLDVSSTTKGFLPPRMTTTQRDAISTPPAGLMIYNTTTNKLNFYNGTAWEAVTSA